jgi:hypothetical protein
MPPNIFFSSIHFRRASPRRMRSASSSLKAIGAPNPHVSPVNQPVFYRGRQTEESA